MPNESHYDHVITLDLDEMLYIGSDIRLFARLTKYYDQDIALFVGAPDNIPIHREEIHQRIHPESNKSKKA